MEYSVYASRPLSLQLLHKSSVNVFTVILCHSLSINDIPLNTHLFHCLSVCYIRINRKETKASSIQKHNMAVS